MNIPKEIQDLMPERREHEKHKDDSSWCCYCGFNQALKEVEAVLPQIIALAEKRGAEGERETILGNILIWSKTATVVETTGNEA